MKNEGAKIGFEEKIKELENIITQLEDNSLNLEDSIKLFEKGMKLSKECRKILDNAERKVSVLIADESGNMDKKDFS